MADITKINLNGTDLTIVDSAATSAIASEVSRAQGAESAITSALSAEVVARQSADTQIQTALSGKADASTTLSGYGITDAYTKTEVDTALAGKANTATTYTKTEVDNAITAATSGLQETLTAGAGIAISSANVISCTVDTGLYVVVTTLPAQPAAGNENKIHLVPLASGETQNMYAEYIWKGDAWEKLGEKQIDTDLTDYWTSAQTQSAITAATSGLASTGYVDSAITDALGAGVVEEGSVENIFSSAGIVGYETNEETGDEAMVVNSMATADELADAISVFGEHIYEQGNLEDILADAGIAYYDIENEEYVVNQMATQNYIPTVANADYNAQTETLIINLPTTPA